jgi:hypothetical protein
VFQTCVTCNQPTILGCTTDNHPIVMDADPVTDGQAVLVGSHHQQPTAVFGVETEDDAAWYRVPFDSDRYDRHECKEIKHVDRH